MCRSDSKDLCTLEKGKQHGLLCFLLVIYLSLYFYFTSYIVVHVFSFLFPQLVPSDSEVGDEKSVLTRTETLSITICFKEPCHLLPYFSRGSVFFFAIYCN